MGKLATRELHLEERVEYAIIAPTGERNEIESCRRAGPRPHGGRGT